jgi:serine/threonine-protein kinase
VSKAPRYDHLSAEAQARVDRLCDQYEQDCKQGAKIEAYLGKLGDAEERAALLEQLLRVDLEQRLGSSRPPSSAEYLRRFPSLDPLWLDSLFATTALPAAAPQQPAVSLPKGLPQRVGRYQIEREIARGGMGAVYRARDIAAPGHTACA